MGGSVTVITPTLPGRESLLDQCRASVAAQTVACNHRVEADLGRVGPAAIRNRLARAASTDWVLPLDDDDLLDPDCVERLVTASDGADVIYPWCRMEGRTDGWVPNKLFNPVGLSRQNFIPVTALIRRDAFEMLAGYRQVQMEDWDLWRRSQQHGLTIRCLPEVLWTYRAHTGQNFQRERAA